MLNYIIHISTEHIDLNCVNTPDSAVTLVMITSQLELASVLKPLLNILLLRSETTVPSVAQYLAPSGTRGMELFGGVAGSLRVQLLLGRNGGGRMWPPTSLLLCLLSVSLPLCPFPLPGLLFPWPLLRRKAMATQLPSCFSFASQS